MKRRVALLFIALIASLRAQTLIQETNVQAPGGGVGQTGRRLLFGGFQPG